MGCELFAEATAEVLLVNAKIAYVGTVSTGAKSFLQYPNSPLLRATILIKLLQALTWNTPGRHSTGVQAHHFLLSKSQLLLWASPNPIFKVIHRASFSSCYSISLLMKCFPRPTTVHLNMSPRVFQGRLIPPLVLINNTKREMERMDSMQKTIWKILNTVVPFMK